MIVSIDIGTSNSSICMMGADGNIVSLDVSTGASIYGDKHSLPSAVFVEDSGNLVLGQAAMNNRMLKPQNFRAEFKRNLGEKYPIVLGSRSFLPEELYTEFFRYLVSCVRKLTNEPIELAYLTYPATYGTSKKEKIVAAAKAAGLFHTELVDEPSAAAMNYCAEGHVHDKQNLLVYDFGGGTFDVSVIRYENGEFRSLTGALGLERCGGVDIDRMIFQDMMSKIPADLLEMLKKNELYYMRFVSQLSESAVRCKKHLSSADVYSENIMVGFETVSYSLTLEQFNQMIAGLVSQTIQTCRRILADAKLQVSDLSAVLLVGGTSRIRLVREMVEQMAGSVPVYNAADLELIVSHGALNYRNYKVAPPKPEPKAETKQNERPVSNVKNGQKDDKKIELPNNRTSSDKHIQKVKDLPVDELLDRVTWSTRYGLEMILPDRSLWSSKNESYGGKFGNLRKIYRVQSGYGHELYGIREDGTTVSTNLSVDGWKNIHKLYIYDSEKLPRAIVGLRKDGSVVTTDNEPKLQKCLSEWQGIREIAHSTWNEVHGLQEDGTVIFAEVGCSTVRRWKDIVSICSDGGDVLGLRKDGKVVTKSTNSDVKNVTPHWKDICAIASGLTHFAGLCKNGTVKATGWAGHDEACDVGDWKNIKAIACGRYITVGLREDGTVVAAGNADYGLRDVKDWKDIIAIKACENSVIGIRNDGRVLYTQYEDKYEVSSGFLGFGTKVRKTGVKKLLYGITPVSLF